MDQPPAVQHATAVRDPDRAAGALVWESDLTDVAALPLTAVDDLTPLSAGARLLDEVLRARSGVKGGSDGPGGARAE
ncbi:MULTISPECIES: hypothetical protein [unclassified Streptomyces]|uniref:hypothetical protein n=1 Tax=unclassified Streptomyces TaxID=2593676 RepID=UPI00342ADAD8